MNRTIKSCFSRLCIKGLAVLLLLAILLGGCTGGSEREESVLRLGIAVYQQEDTFISTVVQHMERLAREEELEKDIKISLTITDGRSNQTVQLEQMDRFLDQGCDVICVNIVDRTAAAVLIDKAEEAAVPLIFFNRQPVEEDMERWEQVYYVGAKAAESGRLQGQIVRDLWQNERGQVDRNGNDVLEYVMLEGEPGHQDTLLRTKYAIDALTSVGIRVRKLASESANWNRAQAAQKMSLWLEEQGGDIEAVFANNDDMALGAIDACLSAGLSAESMPLVVGVDATPPALEAIRAGTLKGTVLNDSEGMAKTMIDLSLALSRGEDPALAAKLEEGHYIWLPYRRIEAKDLSREE